MISAPGSKALVSVIVAGFVFVALLLSALLSLKREKIQLYEKKYNTAVSYLEDKNLQEIRGEEVNQR